MPAFTTTIFILICVQLSAAVHHEIVDGATNNNDHEVECHPNEDTVSCGNTVNRHGNYKIGVRCCDDSSGVGMTPSGCPKQKTYDEAKSICEGLSKRLCTKTELESNAARGTGCQFDGYHVWSSNTCVVPTCPTPDPTHGPTTQRPSPSPITPTKDPTHGPTTQRPIYAISAPTKDPTRGPTDARRILIDGANFEHAQTFIDTFFHINFIGKHFDVTFGLSYVSKIVLCIVGMLLFITCNMIICDCLFWKNKKNKVVDFENRAC